MPEALTQHKTVIVLPFSRLVTEPTDRLPFSAIIFPGIWHTEKPVSSALKTLVGGNQQFTSAAEND